MEKTGQVAQAGASMGVDVLGQSGIGNQGYYPTEHNPKQTSEASDSTATEPPARSTTPTATASPTTFPPEAQAAVEDGAFIA